MSLHRSVRRAALTTWLCAAPLMALAHEGEHEHEHESESEAVHDEHDHDHAGHDHAHPSISLSAVFADPVFLASLVSFGVLAGLMAIYVRPMIHRSLEARRQDIEDAVEEARLVREEAEARRAEYEERMAHLDEEIARVQAEMKRAAESEHGRILAQAEERAEVLRRDTQFQIEQKIKQVREELRAQSVRSVVEAAQAILQEKATSADQQRLANAYASSVQALINEEVQA